MLTFKVFFQLTFFYVAPEPEPSPISAPLSAQKYKQPCTLSISTSANKKKTKIITTLSPFYFTVTWDGVVEVAVIFLTPLYITS